MLTDTSSAVNGCPGSRRPLVSNFTKPATNGDFANSAPRATVIQNREIEVILDSANTVLLIIILSIVDRLSA